MSADKSVPVERNHSIYKHLQTDTLEERTTTVSLLHVCRFILPKNVLVKDLKTKHIKRKGYDATVAIQDAGLHAISRFQRLLLGLFIIIKNEKIRATLCENAAEALYIDRKNVQMEWYSQ